MDILILKKKQRKIKLSRNELSSILYKYGYHFRKGWCNMLSEKKFNYVIDDIQTLLKEKQK